MATQRKKISIVSGFPDETAREEFFRLPRVEFLMERLSRVAKKDVSKMVVNSRLEMADRFTMKVSDNRMADAGIRKGDHVIIQRQAKYREGDVLAIKLGKRTFIRRYYRSANRIRLECHTPDRQTMILDDNTPGFAILGCVIQVIREF